MDNCETFKQSKSSFVRAFNGFGILKLLTYSIFLLVQLQSIGSALHRHSLWIGVDPNCNPGVGGQFYLDKEKADILTTIIGNENANRAESVEL